MQAFSVKYLIYILIIFTATSCSNYQKIVKSGTPKEKYDAAKKYYKDKDYLRAQPLLEDLLSLYYGRKEREEIYYLYSYSYYANGEFLLAGYHFDNFVQTYSLSAKKEEAAYMSAVCKHKRTMPYELDQTPTKTAINAFQSFINQYPNSQYVQECNDNIDKLRKTILLKVYESAKLYHSLGYYKSAMVACTNALDDYPDMIHRSELSYLTVDASFKYAKNSVKAKQSERYTETLAKIKDFNKEFSKTEDYRKEINKIKNKAEAEIASLK